MSDSDQRIPTSPDALAKFREYHRLVLSFARDALGTDSLQILFDEAVRCAARGSGAGYAKVLEYRPVQDDLLVVAGIGWKPGVVGHATLSSALRSPQGRAFRTGTPTYGDDLPASTEFDYPALLREHAIVSLVNVPITVDGKVWGVLEVDSPAPRRFDTDDKDFLGSFATIIGRTIENRRLAAHAAKISLEKTIELGEREALFRELQHRIGNQLQSILGALELAKRSATDPAARQALDQISDRIVSIALSHEQLSLAQVEQDISLGPFLADILSAFATADGVRLITSIEDATAPLRLAVRLGLIVNELVTNSVKHAFGAEGGTISVQLATDAARAEGRLTVSDDGRGIGEIRDGGAGMGLIAILAAQIGAAVERQSSESSGTMVQIRFPLPPRP